MSLVLALVIALQAQPQFSDRALYNRILDQTRPAERIPLALEFEKTFPQSTLITDVYELLMDDYTARNDTVKALEYGEKALKVKPENLRVLVAVSYRLAVAGRDLDRATSYAQRAIKVADRMKNQAPPPSYTRESWVEFVSRNRASAEGTLKYIREIPAGLLRRRP